MKIIMGLALAAATALAGCATGGGGVGGTVTLSSVGSTTATTSSRASNEAFQRQINPQRPRDCPRYVVDAQDPCY
jgi:ABC-type phosphate transport system substrate-binding protein